MPYIYKKIVIKIGTAVLTTEDGKLDETVMKNIVDEIVQLKKAGIEVILVSSGAVACGRSIVKVKKKLDEVTQKQVFAAVGHIHLMNKYIELFKKHNLTCAQILATRFDFKDRQHYMNIRNCFEGLLQDDIIPIVNENDAVSVRELMFTDNDQLAGLISSMMGMEALIILTHVDGIFTGHPKDPGSYLIEEINENNISTLPECISPKKSEFGRGGMLTKSKIAEKLMGMGIFTHIINGKNENVISKVLSGERLGTIFVPSSEMSAVKRWVSESEGFEKGFVYINAGAEKALKSKEMVASLLPVGVTKIEGDFEKGEILKIINEQGEDIGYGMANYDSKIARDCMGKKDQKALIKYDYLFVKM